MNCYLLKMGVESIKDKSIRRSPLPVVIAPSYFLYCYIDEIYCDTYAQLHYKFFYRCLFFI